MRRFLRAAALACALGSAARAHAFVRSTSAPLHPDKGVCLWWKPRRITYLVNLSGLTSAGCAIDAASQLAQASFPAWMNATRSGETSPCTDFAFSSGGETTGTSVGYDQTPRAANMNLVVYRAGSCADPTIAPAADPCHATPGACAAKFNCWDHAGGALGANTLALTTTTFLVDTGEILDADMELNGWNGNSEAPQDGTDGWYFTCGGPSLPTCSSPPYGQSACNWIDVGNTVTHEAGHMIGLDHACVASYPPPYDACPSPTPVMAPTAVLGETRKRLLTADDIDAVCTIYPAGAATRTCIPPADGAATKGGCGSGDAGVATLAAAVLWYALRRRRQATARAQVER